MLPHILEFWQSWIKREQHPNTTEKEKGGGYQTKTKTNFENTSLQHLQQYFVYYFIKFSPFPDPLRPTHAISGFLRTSLGELWCTDVLLLVKAIVFPRVNPEMRYERRSSFIASGWSVYEIRKYVNLLRRFNNKHRGKKAVSVITAYRG